MPPPPLVLLRLLSRRRSLPSTPRSLLRCRRPRADSLQPVPVPLPPPLPPLLPTLSADWLLPLPPPLPLRLQSARWRKPPPLLLLLHLLLWMNRVRGGKLPQNLPRLLLPLLLLLLPQRQTARQYRGLRCRHPLLNQCWLPRAHQQAP